jgi:hypothetical protein
MGGGGRGGMGGGHGGQYGGSNEHHNSAAKAVDFWTKYILAKVE